MFINNLLRKIVGFGKKLFQLNEVLLMKADCMVSPRFVAVIVAVAFVVLLAIVLTKQPEVKTAEEAVKFALDDLNSDAQVAGSDKIVKLFSANYSEETKQWTAVMKITLAPHSQCPTVLIRAYQLLPIRHGLDKTVTRDCSLGEPIAFEEEAIIASKKALSAEFVSRAYACGYKLPLEEKAVKEYCADADLAALQGFASDAPGAKWIAEWRANGERKLIALDNLGKVLKAG